MRWKVLLGVFLIILIAALLYSKPLSGWMPLKLPKVTLPSSLDVLTNQLKPSKYYNVILEANTRSVLGQRFSLINSTLTIKGICTTPIIVGNTNINLANKRCNVTLYAPEGETYITNSGTVIINSKFKKVVVNGIPITSSSPISFEILPSKLLGSITSKELILNNFNGKIKKLTSKGNVFEIVHFPPCKQPKLYNFVGTINLNAKSVVLSGLVSKIEKWCPNA